MKIIFDCFHCRQTQVDKLKVIDDKANEGKALSEQVTTNPDPKLYRVEAVADELTITSRYLKHDTKSSKFDQKTDSGIQLKCSVCGKETLFEMDLWGVTGQ